MKEFRISLPAEVRFSVFAETEAEAMAQAQLVADGLPDHWEVDGSPDGTEVVSCTCYAGALAVYDPYLTIAWVEEAADERR